MHSTGLSSPRKAIAKNYLLMAREEVEKTTRRRNQYVRDAWTHGLTIGEIVEYSGLMRAEVEAVLAMGAAA